MQLRQSERRKAKIKMALQGSAGSGKTYSSLLIAQGLLNGDLSKVAVIDTENGSADLYAHLGNYNVLPLKPPFSPQKFVEAIDICEKAGMEVIILDSISHCWDFLLDYHSSLAGNSFTNWAKIKPLEKLFVDKILQCDAHVIATMRTKQDYVLNQKDGKFVPEKVGLKAVQRDGLDYEFTLVFDVDIKHFAVSSKDRTEIFMDKPEFKITTETGKKILDWCNSGTVVEIPNILSLGEVLKEIHKCKTVAELVVLYNEHVTYQNELRNDFETKKSMILKLTNTNNFSQNGHTQSH